MSQDIFKISGIGIDTSTIEYGPSDERCNQDNYEYIHTSISSNNDFIINKYVESQPTATLITSIGFLDNIKPVILGHLEALGRSKLDLLLFDLTVDLDWDNYGESITNSLKELKEGEVIEEVGLKNPKSIKDIEKIKKYLGDIKYIALDICPFNFNYDIIDWCNTNKINLIGFNCFGGFLSSANLISSFTVPYLLAFSANYCDVVILSGRDLFLSGEEKIYLEKLIGQPNSPKYSLKKNVSGKLVKPYKKVIETSFILKPDTLVLPYNKPGILYSPTDVSINLGKSIIIVPEIESELQTKEEKNLVEMITEQNKLLSAPKDSDLDSKFAYLRYRVMASLKLEFPTFMGWKHSYLKLGDRNLIIAIDKVPEKSKWWKKKKVSTEVTSRIFIFLIPDRKKSVFLEITELDNSINASEKA